MARQKTVFGNKQEVAHAWAKQDQYEGREGSRIQRIFFEGPTIFSYGRHFPIATFHQKKGKEKVVLFTFRTYSPTTSAHVWAARGAVSHFPIISCYDPQEAAAGRHEANMKYWEGRAETIAVKLAKAKKPEKYLSEIASLRSAMESYSAYFHCGIKKYKFRFLFIESQDVGKKLTAKQRAEQAASEKIAKERRAKYEAEQAKREATRIAEEIKDFHEGERDYVRGGEYTYLRFQSGEIQTSKGIKIEFQEAKEYYHRLKSIQQKCKNGQEFNLFGTARDEHTFQGFAMRSAGPEYFEIGCHKIQYTELESLAKAAGFVRQEYHMKEEG